MPRRTSGRNTSLEDLAKELVVYQKRAVLICGAGISVASGVPPFRNTCKNGSTASGSASEAIWNQHVWTQNTRQAFRQDPLTWYNDFWIPGFLETLPFPLQANPAHEAIQQLASALPLKVITQNVDGLQKPQDFTANDNHSATPPSSSTALQNNNNTCLLYTSPSPRD